MQFAILGPLEVRSEGDPVEVLRPRRRALLAFLLLHANRQVSTEQVVDALWCEAPRTARAQVHTAVSGLRGCLPAPFAHSLCSESAGYRLSVRAGALDSAEFSRRLGAAQTLAGQGGKAEAVRMLRSALELWRGTALTGVDAPFAEPARARLGEERVVACKLLADLELEAGRHLELVPELTTWFNEYPAFEAVAERLALALYRSGRQTDALGVIRRIRALLADEFGLAPGHGLAQLEGEILRADPALDHAPALACGRTR
ncbi:AfsR/SARP family transcriptional regulator [Kitasatospora sp. NBC_01287]|uniref:AfsR/SARP family transcriptional regulator n=1 Tax=Kitasatospora sp. NBC_01287 TaxID=2903573 RepID=UPI00224D96C8|nr:AfsR/SARP family transcriptional regulator [Kitasatospora sp. NBC_01287]MCX4750512.1 AfsR/SARP family transcriptional regulator [Kitasatospora sp. NBC_01287]